MRHLSPLRYPGGKARLAPFLTDCIDLNDLRNCNYFEPYAGGAGAALSLLRDNVVSQLHLNDADIRIYSFWRSALTDTDRFVEKILSTPVDLTEWKRQQLICKKPSRHTQFDVGFAAFFMNRCNRSGVLSGAGPIGGYAQAGDWSLSVRFSRAALAERVLELGRNRDRIRVSNLDAIAFLKSRLPLGSSRSKLFVYLDPPYVTNGQRLYLNAYTPSAHRQLARYLKGQRRVPWVMSYDDSPLVRSLYSPLCVGQLPILYSLQVKRAAHELVISPKHLAMPTAFKRIPKSKLHTVGVT